jgi:sterol desaturase/sphingolipid hydroxylase (fatty acid hydroxylase superfamily)
MIADSRINMAAQWLSDYSLTIVLAFAVLAFVLEYVATRADQQSAPRKHWLATWRTNSLFFALTFTITAIIAPWLSPLMNELVQGRQGAMSLIDLPYVARLLIGFLLLDLCGYFFHRAAHRFGWWWRLHQVHHSDVALNASTHFRQHPGSILLSLVLYLALLWALGIPVVSWVIYSALSNVHEMWQHMNVATPAWLDRALRPLMVTPRSHRLHHHPDRAVHDRNFGILLPWWDRLFATAHGAEMYKSSELTATGLPIWSTPQALSFFACLRAPFNAAATPAFATTAITTTKARPSGSRRTQKPGDSQGSTS